MFYPVKTKKKVNYGLFLPILAIPLVLLGISEAYKHLETTDSIVPVLPAAHVIPVETLPTTHVTPSPTPTPIVIKEVKTVVKVIKYKKVYVKTTPWKCGSGKCTRRVRVYGRV